MNWTGGKNARYSKGGAGNSIVNKQKQHFARARARLQHHSDGPRRFQPSFMEHDRPSQETRLSPKNALPKVRQTRLQDFASTGPLAKHLSSIAPRNSRVLKKSQLESLVNNHRPLATSPNRANTISPSRSSPALRKSFRNGGNTIGNSGSHPELLDPINLFSGDYDDDQEVQSISKKHKANQQGCGVQLLEDKRLELLQKPDWMGLNLSRPQQRRILQDVPQPSAPMGKRHRILEQKDMIQPQIHARRIHVPSIQEGYYMSGAIPDNRPISNRDIEIRVGDHALSETTVSRPTFRPLSAAVSFHSTDSMLFDEETELPQSAVEFNLAENLETLHPHFSEAEYSLADVPSTDSQPAQISSHITVHASASSLTIPHNSVIVIEQEVSAQEQLHQIRSDKPHELDDAGPKSTTTAFRLVFPSTIPSDLIQEDVQTQGADRGSILSIPSPNMDNNCEVQSPRHKAFHDQIWRAFMDIPDDGAETTETVPSTISTDGRPFETLAPFPLESYKARDVAIKPLSNPCSTYNKPDTNNDITTNPLQQPHTTINKPNTVTLPARTSKCPEEIWKAFVFGRSSSSSSPDIPAYHSSPKRLSQPTSTHDGNIKSNEAVHSASLADDSSILSPASPSPVHSPIHSDYHFNNLNDRSNLHLDLQPYLDPEPQPFPSSPPPKTTLQSSLIAANGTACASSDDPLSQSQTQPHRTTPNPTNNISSVSASNRATVATRSIHEDQDNTLREESSSDPLSWSARRVFSRSRVQAEVQIQAQSRAQAEVQARSQVGDRGGDKRLITRKKKIERRMVFYKPKPFGGGMNISSVGDEEEKRDEGSNEEEEDDIEEA